MAIAVGTFDAPKDDDDTDDAGGVVVLDAFESTQIAFDIFASSKGDKDSNRTSSFCALSSLVESSAARVKENTFFRDDAPRGRRRRKEEGRRTDDDDESDDDCATQHMMRCWGKK
tara:strand:+ start:899 stop:1243 length:345 start_codon:yes stop_codon:yes gene_type:complete